MDQTEQHGGLLQNNTGDKNTTQILTPLTKFKSQLTTKKAKQGQKNKCVIQFFHQNTNTPNLLQH